MVYLYLYASPKCCELPGVYQTIDDGWVSSAVYPVLGICWISEDPAVHSSRGFWYVPSKLGVVGPDALEEVGQVDRVVEVHPAVPATDVVLHEPARAKCPCIVVDGVEAEREDPDFLEHWFTDSGSLGGARGFACTRSRASRACCTCT